MTITIKHMIDCASRELELRKKVYPRRIELGKMSEHQALWEINVMNEILATLKDLELKKQPDLFLGKGK